MSSSWNEPLPLMSQDMCNRMIERTDEYLSQVQWRGDCSVTTLKDAVAMAKLNKDAGKTTTLNLRPMDRIFENWMNWNNLVTFLYNRDTSARTLLSAYRNAILNSRDTM